MIFGKNKKSKIPSFPKEKLSALAIDHFVEKYCDGTPGPHRKFQIHYAKRKTNYFFTSTST